MHSPKSALLKDYLLDDLSSCSSNGFRSYPRRQCCTKVCYLIEIDLNKHIKLPQRSQSKRKSKSKLQRASAAVANVFKSLQLSSNATKPNFLVRNLSRKLSNRGSLKKSRESVRGKVSNRVIEAVASNDSNISDSTDSSFTMSSDLSTEINVAQNDVVEERDRIETVITTKERKNEEKNHFSPVSVMDFPKDNDDDDKDEHVVTSPFKRSQLYREGSKRKLSSKVKRTKTLAQLKPVRLEDRITLSESSLEDNRAQNKAIALLHLLKTTLPSHNLSKSKMSVLLGFFTQRIIDGNVSNDDLLQEAKDWINDQPRETFGSQNYKLTYIKYMEKGVKWLKYNDEVEKEGVGLELEYEVFTSLVEEILFDFKL